MQSINGDDNLTEIALVVESIQIGWVIVTKLGTLANLSSPAESGQIGQDVLTEHVGAYLAWPSSGWAEVLKIDCDGLAGLKMA